MALQLNLEKSAGALKLSLEKKGIITPPSADLAFDLDVSGSYEKDHRHGHTQALLERLVPWGMVFDPDKKLDVFTFSDGPEHAVYVGEITPDTCEGYIKSNIIGKVRGWNGGTDYSYVLEKNLQHFGWLPQDAATPAKIGRLGRLFGHKPAATSQSPQEKRRSIVLFVTDGSTNDERRTRQVLKASQDRGDQTYFLFIGCHEDASNFDFLKDIGDEFSNTGLMVVNNTESFRHMTDEALNEQMIGDELVQWLKAS